MEISIVQHREVEYKVANFTYYHIETADEVIRAIENARLSNARVRVHYGETSGKEVGRDWNDIYDVTGRIGRSTGPVKIPILIYNSRSISGGAILTHCIVKITQSNGKKKALYQHANYHVREAVAEPA